MSSEKPRSELDAIVAEALTATMMPVGMITFLSGAGETVAAARGWNPPSLAPGYGFASRMAGATDVVVIPDKLRPE